MRFRRRLLLLYVLFSCALGIVWLRALQLQAFDGDRWERAARDLRRQVQRLDALRGPILSADGAVLAEDIPVFQIAVRGWEWLHRDRARCTGCGLVHFARSSGRLPRRCRCGAGGGGRHGRLERLPPGDLGPLEAALGLRPGELTVRADERVAAIRKLVAEYRRLLESRPDDSEFLIDDKVELRENDLMMRPYVVVPDAPERAVRLVETDEVGRYRGFRVQTTLRRRYPLGDFASQLLGFASVVQSEEEYEALVARFGSHVTPSTRVGRRGLERAYNWSLHGTPGRRVLQLEPGGTFTHVVEDAPPVPGRPLRLTLSAQASREAEAILEREANPAGYLPAGRPSAAFVMLDARTGAVLVWAEAPRFDLNTELDEIFDPQHLDAVADKEARVWNPRGLLDEGMDLDTWRAKLVVPEPVSLSRVAAIAVEPGSTMKPLIALGMLGSGRPLPYASFTCRDDGRKPGCHGCGAEFGLVHAIAKSCNRYFAFSLRNSRHWPVYRHAVAAFVDALGFGHPPGHEVREWSRGQWLWPWVDFGLDEAVALADAYLKSDLGARAPVLALSLSPRAPGRVAGSPTRLANLLAAAAKGVVQHSDARHVVVHVAREANEGRMVVLRFGVRAARRPAWTVLPEAAQGRAALPGVLRRRDEETAGVTGTIARGGTTWFKVTFERHLGRDDPSAPPVIRPDDGRNVAIGQGPVRATPLQMARAMAAIANGGLVVEPHVVDAVGHAERQSDGRALLLDPRHLDLVHRGMRAAVTMGTARHANWELVPATVYGKTGTAQVGDSWKPWDAADPGGPWHHWFVGFAEGHGGRQVAFACVLHSRTEAGASQTAVKAVQQILSRWYAVHGSD